jgi:hypothetical protein
MQHEPSTSVVVYDSAFADAEKLALAGFLAGYRGSTRDAYALALRQFVSWCADHRLALFSVRRADIESYARALEQRGRARATVARRLCTVAGFYRYAEEEGLLALSPAVHVCRPRLADAFWAVALGPEGGWVAALARTPPAPDIEKLSPAAAPIAVCRTVEAEAAHRLHRRGRPDRRFGRDGCVLASATERVT